ncbi:MAG: hypothetical protein M1820_000778 [Bogoriella megaspora]|nr:MAG: hypothetical protein M1820_000778 [Bogoriella megaspora]
MAAFSTLKLAGLVSLLASNTVLGAILLENIASVPAGWKLDNTPSGDSQITLQVALAQQNLDRLESKLQAVSTPNSPSYGDYLTQAEINSIFGASNESSEAVKSWLESSGVKNYVTRGDSIWFQTSVSNANSMLGTTFHNFADATGTKKLRTTQYSIPQDLSAHIDLIAPTTFFGKTKAMRALQARHRSSPYNHVPEVEPLSKRQSGLPEACQNRSLVLGNNTYPIFDGPACLKAEYNVNDYKADPRSGSKVAFASFLNQSFSFADLFTFEKQYNIPAQNISVILVNPEDGATALPQPPDPSNDGEANLDSQYMVGIANPLPVSEFITAGSPPFIPDPVTQTNTNEPYLPYYEFLLAQNDLPQVISTSYGDEEQTVPEKYAIRVCNQAGLLGLRGISVLESSGDEGVGASCLTQDQSAPQFNPIFPATCPYLLSVGGTVRFNPEIAWVGSSGGFSNYFSTAFYQQPAVSNYLDNYVSAETKEYYGQYANFSGRGFPDVAAHSVSPDYPVFQNGPLTPSGGTSAAVPVTASIIALLNDARLRAGKPVLGFLNPLIYDLGNEAFTDITGGQSNGCDGFNTQSGNPVPGGGVIPGSHWNATVG